MANGEKLTGPEMMLRSVLKALGVNGDQIMGDMQTVIKSMTTGLQETVLTLQAIRSEQIEQRQLIEALFRELKIPMPHIGEPAPVAGLIEQRTEN